MMEFLKNNLWIINEDPEIPNGSGEATDPDPVTAPTNGGSGDGSGEGATPVAGEENEKEETTEEQTEETEQTGSGEETAETTETVVSMDYSETLSQINDNIQIYGRAQLIVLSLIALFIILRSFFRSAGR